MVFLPILIQLLLYNRERARKASRELIRERNDTSGGGRVSQTILWPWQFKVNRWNVLSFLTIFHHSKFFYLPCTHAPTHLQTHTHTRTHTHARTHAHPSFSLGQCLKDVLKSETDKWQVQLELQEKQIKTCSFIRSKWVVSIIKYS